MPLIIHGLRFELLTADATEMFAFKELIEQEMLVRKNGQLTTSLTFQKEPPPLVAPQPSGEEQ